MHRPTLTCIRYHAISSKLPVRFIISINVHRVKSYGRWWVLRNSAAATKMNLSVVGDLKQTEVSQKSRKSTSLRREENSQRLWWIMSKMFQHWLYLMNELAKNELAIKWKFQCIFDTTTRRVFQYYLILRPWLSDFFKQRLSLLRD